MLCFIKNVTQNKVYDQGISSHVSHSALSLYFKLWDAGGHLFHPSPCGQGEFQRGSIVRLLL
jgi:hypothetical protein